MPNEQLRQRSAIERAAEAIGAVLQQQGSKATMEALAIAALGVERNDPAAEKAMRERDCYRAALERIEMHGVGYAVGIARAALEGDQ